LPDSRSSEARRNVAALRRLVDDSGRAFVVYDLEYTSWEGAEARRWSGPGEVREIVQIGAVKLVSLPGQVEIESLDLLVRPHFRATLSDYFIDLTGITQADVDTKGLPFAEALRRFADFAAGGAALSNGDDNEVLAINCSLHGLTNPFSSDALVNIARELRGALNYDRALRSADLAGWLGAPSPGRAHQGLADSRSIAIALRRALEDPD